MRCLSEATAEIQSRKHIECKTFVAVNLKLIYVIEGTLGAGRTSSFPQVALFKEMGNVIFSYARRGGVAALRCDR